MAEPMTDDAPHARAPLMHEPSVEHRAWYERSLVQLTLVRFREFMREPEAVFWTFAFPIILALGLGIPARAADRPASLEQVLKLIQSEINPDQAMDFMRHVYSTDRWFTFPKFEETAEYVRGTMEEIGLSKVEVLGAPADGRRWACHYPLDDDGRPPAAA